MQTTLEIDEQLLKSAKQIAVETGRTLAAVVEEALRESLSRRDEGSKRIRLRTHGMGGVLPGVDLDNTSGLLDRMDGLDDPR